MFLFVVFQRRPTLLPSRIPQYQRLAHMLDYFLICVRRFVSVCVLVIYLIKAPILSSYRIMSFVLKPTKLYFRMRVHLTDFGYLHLPCSQTTGTEGALHLSLIDAVDGQPHKARSEAQRPHRVTHFRIQADTTRTQKT